MQHQVNNTKREHVGVGLRGRREAGETRSDWDLNEHSRTKNQPISVQLEVGGYSARATSLVPRSRCSARSPTVPESQCAQTSSHVDTPQDTTPLPQCSKCSDTPGCRVTVGGDARDKLVLCSNRIRNVSLLTPVTLVLSVNVTNPAEPGDAVDAGTVTPPTVTLVTLDPMTCKAAAS
jgi:hypothetical protein